MARRETPAEARERRGAVADPEAVFAAGLRFLEARSRSVAEVRRRLTGAGYRPELVDGAIGRLLDMGVLDDEAFARGWLESRDRARPRGEHALRQELRLKGIDRTTVDDLLADRRDAAPGTEEVEVAAAGRLLDRHARALGRIADPRRQRQRAYALLARNGFDPGTASDVAKRWLTERAAGAEPGADG